MKKILLAVCGLSPQVITETLPFAPVAVLSGPSFASEIAVERPTAVTLACADPALGQHLVAEIGGARFGVYLTDDLVGAQLGGLMKNVLAIACGMVTGPSLPSGSWIAAPSAVTRTGMNNVATIGAPSIPSS